jgi:methylated-DNA-[protein]-cysteine S-methyltransferase
LQAQKNISVSFQQFGTAFQQSVWDELIHIPFGKTISYLELSRRIGNTKAVELLAPRMANQLCIVVPCHRVIGSNGQLVGYGGEL